jgi:hypothetical protein
VKHVPRFVGATTVALLVMFVVALVQAAPAFAADPNNVGLTLEGCKEPAIPASYNPPADLVCNSGDYTTGNLGKNWEELDLVPHRLTAEAKNAAPATQTYTVSVVADHEDVTRPGYDFISVPVVNASLSTAGACNISVGALQTGSLGGGIDLSMWREITFTNQPKNSTCVLDFVERLAVGSHLFPGAALHSNVADEDQGSIGAREVPLPVNEIQPQQLAKEMSATQDTDHVWNITKGATPDELNFSNTCDSTSLTSPSRSSGSGFPSRVKSRSSPTSTPRTRRTASSRSTSRTSSTKEPRRRPRWG